MNDFFKSVSDVIKERLSSHFVGAFVISWIGWNYRVFVVVFSSADFHDKLNYIDTTLYAPNIKVYLLIWYPLWTSLAVLLVYPVFDTLAYAWLKLSHVVKRRIRKEMERLTTITQEELQVINKVHAAEVSDRDNEINRLNRENARLLTQVENLNRQAAIKEVQSNDLPALKSKTSREILIYLNGHISDTTEPGDVLPRFRELRNAEEVRDAMNELEAIGLVDTPNGHIRITKKGRELAKTLQP